MAGSERLSGINFDATGNGAAGFQELSPINSGLLALSNVTAALGDPRRKASHIPYWDSKLTCLLKVRRCEKVLNALELYVIIYIYYRIHLVAMLLLY